ncbi:tRNA (adenosine(37)-N6)-dimethylallyltransferase MiaA [Rhodoplanes sp. TEM]|uniref:tRNA dimethylallyltransferase n=1 Tax=Rhodoplanes tepidamans TaxID=200616 RepID=A0ABT5J4U6_RHOTP|nr:MULTISPECIES: tRNA (adenosine(37)-N6)-dimethylallyltransferase MiaA [Rhodoplanes]MDC7784647.1 tRNA (adenosine(37)-N6)-dimethylallyltransferase MiaA [Rhodoplanes tepidamans]MDC7982114.1 tRNA (adenosine(37)-N6)-dimethylallyltransferase MiaA [Rhodoplanes sp. TEM]MDQ0356115.1 tRNA dimethylallyltransferase [Rhodoplanes tepidamans]
MSAIDAILIAGPTASGKSALALALAEALDGVVINADSMQVYRDLRIITARPTPDEEARMPHRLYGHVDAAVNYSVGHWLADARTALAAARGQGRLPIVCGGTGLYFKALTQGLSRVPPVPGEIRDAVREQLDRLGPEGLHAELARRDAGEAARLEPRDRLRVARALEVLLATGRPLTAWHAETDPPLLDPARVVTAFLAPDRAALYARIDARFLRMLEDGALEEVQALGARGLDPLLPAMRAHGVPGLLAHLAGTMSRQAGVDKGQADTRHYAKRQFTWFRHQLPDWPWLAPEQALHEVLRRASSGRAG